MIIRYCCKLEIIYWFCGLLISKCALLFLLFHIVLLHTSSGANLHSNPADPINNQAKYKGKKLVSEHAAQLFCCQDKS